MGLFHTRVATTANDPAADVQTIRDWNAEHIVDTNGLAIVADATTPAAPASGYVQVFGQDQAGAMMVAYRAPVGLPSVLQPFMGQRKIAIWSPVPNNSGTTGALLGLGSPTTLGTATARAIATSGYLAAMIRVGYVTATTTNSRAQAYFQPLAYWRGNSAGSGGFRAVFRFGASDAATVATANTFVGFAASSTIASGGTEPSASGNIVGIGADSTDANLSIYTNDGTGTATKIALGTSFPANTLGVDAYELVLYAPPNAAAIGYQVTRLNTGDTISGSLTTDLPVSTQQLMPMFMRGNTSTALAVGLDIMGLYIETEN